MTCTAVRIEGWGPGPAPRVSVVIPFLNAERFLPEAVDGVFAQSYQDWELLLVDDGSSDRSTELARHYVTCAPARVRYLEHPGHENRGISASRNLGVRHARGAYVAFLDADDVWFPTKLEQQVPILDTYPEVDLVYGTTLVWYSWNESPQEATRDYVPEVGMPLAQVIPAPLLLSRMLRREAHCPPISNAFFRRTAILGAGLFEEQFRGMHEDQAFLAKLCLRSRVFVSGECWHKYRQHADSCLARATKAHRRAARERYLKWLRVYLAKQGRRDSEVWRIVEEQLQPYGLMRRLRSRALQTARRVLPAPMRSRLRRWLSIIGATP
jgi:glycosyltransferase involved in cell wall biosynthesis